MVERSSAGGNGWEAWSTSLHWRVPSLRCLISLLLVLALTVGALGQIQTVWMCEGKVCSPDLAKCCCVSKEEIRDNACFGATLEMPKGFCTGKCRCQPSVTVQSVVAFAAVKSIAELIPLPIDTVAILSVPLDLSPTCALLTLTYMKPMPPPRGVLRPVAAVPCLRAPPAAPLA